MEANGIVLSPDPRLRQECAVIEEITPAIEALAEKMKKMMFENGGCGLAAPQIGELIQLVTIDCDYSDKNDYDPYVLINPVIVEQSDHLVPFSEGCLSIPGISCEIERPDHVVVEAYDLDANLIRYEACTATPCSSDSSRCRGSRQSRSTRTPWPAALDRARRSRVVRPLLPQGLGFAPCSNSPARTKSTLSALRLVRNCAWSNNLSPAAEGDCVYVLVSPGCRWAREGRLR